MRKFVFTALFVLMALASHARTYDRDSLLRELDRTVAEASTYTQLLEVKIANARKELSRTAGNEEKARLLCTLSNLFFLYQSDSALAFNAEAIEYAMRMNATPLYVTLMCDRALLLGHAGLPSYAFALLDTLSRSPKAISPELKKKIYESYFDINDFVYHYNLPGSLLTDNARFIADIRDSFYHYCPEVLEQALHTNASITSNKEVIDNLKQRLERAETDGERGTLCMVISNRYRSEAMAEQRDIYLILSAIYNIRAARMDNEALISLSRQMIANEEWTRAVAYLRLAHRQALHYGSRSRLIQLSPLLEQLENHEIEKAATWKTIAIVTTLAFSLLMVIIAFAIYYQRKRARQTQAQLRQLLDSSAHANARDTSNQAQIEAQADALTHFLGIATDATFEFVHLRHLVVRKLKNNDASALLKQLTVEDGIGKTQTELLRKFDIAFMRLYPDFIIKVNQLMLPEAQISKPENELMSTELRLLALWRLGITDAGRVATILNLSVNTIYFYRNKLRNGAKDREHFNDGILAIKSV